MLRCQRLHRREYGTPRRRLRRHKVEMAGAGDFGHNRLLARRLQSISQRATLRWRNDRIARPVNEPYPDA